MSINPPTDIVLDVVRAADPARRAEAAGRLVRLANEGGDFTATLDEVNPVPTRSVAVAEVSRAKAGPADAAKAYQGFEGMVLSTFVEYAFPKDSTAFGAGMAGSVWRSMLAQQIGAEMAAGGGIGIADSIAAPSLLTSNAERGMVATLSPDPADDAQT